jgi:hypothetical protein
MPEGGAVGAQLVGRHPGRREALFAEQLAHQLDGRRPVATTLDQDLEDLALVVDGRPQLHLLARDPDDHFAHQAGWRGGRASYFPVSVLRAALVKPTTNWACGPSPVANGSQ